jgi:hypothetical protein
MHALDRRARSLDAAAMRSPDCCADDLEKTAAGIFLQRRMPGVDRCLSVYGPREDFRSSPSSIEMSLPSKICVAVISMLLECKPLRVA